MREGGSCARSRNWKIIIITLEINGHLSRMTGSRAARSKGIYPKYQGGVWGFSSGGVRWRDVYEGGACKWRRGAPIVGRTKGGRDYAYRVWRHTWLSCAYGRYDSRILLPAFTAGQSSLRRRIYCRLSRDRFFSFFLSAPFSLSLSPSLPLSFSLSLIDCAFVDFIPRGKEDWKEKKSMYAWDWRGWEGGNVGRSTNRFREVELIQRSIYDVSLITRLRSMYFSRSCRTVRGKNNKIHDWSRRHTIVADKTARREDRWTIHFSAGK